jgi:acyl carrier protein
MEKRQFLQTLKDELEFEVDLDFTTNLHELEEWDSMSAMVLIGFISDKFGKTLTGENLKKIISINGLIEYIGVEKFK